jgi:amino acid transporter
MEHPKLERKISLFQACAINMIDMVGIGPFVVLSIVADTMQGPSFLYAWLAGALLSICDAFIWCELGATFPKAGGSYNFLKESFGAKAGGVMSFLFVWQTLIQAPLVIASAAIGFSQYFSYLSPLSPNEAKMVSGSVVLAVILLLYRKVEDTGKISVLLWSGVILTLTWIIAGGLLHGSFAEPIKHMNEDFECNSAFAVALGLASVKTVYSYLGYYNVCHLGGEISNPNKNIPRSMLISIIGICILYLMMNISVASVLPFETIRHSKFVVSEFVEVISGPVAAKVATALILWVAFASVFSATLGYSRIPYAAAKDGAFFSVFGKLHPVKKIPHISLLVLGAVAFLLSLTIKMKEAIDAILAMRILIQFVGQAVGLILLRKRRGVSFMAWKMPLYPLPVILAIVLWLSIFYSTGTTMMLAGIKVIVLGVSVYFLKRKFIDKRNLSDRVKD